MEERGWGRDELLRREQNHRHRGPLNEHRMDTLCGTGRVHRRAKRAGIRAWSRRCFERVNSRLDYGLDWMSVQQLCDQSERDREQRKRVP